PTTSCAPSYDTVVPRPPPTAPPASTVAWYAGTLLSTRPATVGALWPRSGPGASAPGSPAPQPDWASSRPGAAPRGPVGDGSPAHSPDATTPKPAAPATVGRPRHARSIDTPMNFVITTTRLLCVRPNRRPMIRYSMECNEAHQSRIRRIFAEAPRAVSAA